MLSSSCSRSRADFGIRTAASFDLCALTRLVVIQTPRFDRILANLIVLDRIMLNAQARSSALVRRADAGGLHARE